MFCTKCGTQLPEDSVFCSECGTKQRENIQSQVISNKVIKTALPPEKIAKKKKNIKIFASVCGSVLGILILIIMLRLIFLV